MNSRAEGWSIADVVGHMGAGCHAMFGPAVLTIMRADAVERINDQMVEVRRDRTPAQILGEYRRWSRVLAATTPAMTRRPLARVELPIGELGRFPARVLASALVFDHHTHLTHDMAPALGRTVPAPGANRMAAVLEWMMAVLSNQIRSAKPVWLDRPLSITLTGPGGGSWWVDGSGVVTLSAAKPVAAEITAVAGEFPEWGTRRASWGDRDVSIAGDADYAVAFLDWINIV